MHAPAPAPTTPLEAQLPPSRYDPVAAAPEDDEDAVEDDEDLVEDEEALAEAAVELERELQISALRAQTLRQSIRQLQQMAPRPAGAPVRGGSGPSPSAGVSRAPAPRREEAIDEPWESFADELLGRQDDDVDEGERAFMVYPQATDDDDYAAVNSDEALFGPASPEPPSMRFAPEPAPRMTGSLSDRI